MVRGRVPVALVRYAVVGALGTAVNYAIYALLLLLGGVPYPLASAIGYVTGTFAAYPLNRRWTFGIREHRGELLLRYVAVQTAGVGLTVAVLTVLVEVAGVPALLAQAFAIVAANVVTFFVNRRWSFGDALAS